MACADVLPGTVQSCMHNTDTNTHTTTTSLYVTSLPLSFLPRSRHESYLWPVPMSFLARYMPAFRIQTQNTTTIATSMAFPFLAGYTVESHAKVRKSFPHHLLTRSGTSTSAASPVVDDVISILPFAANSSGAWVWVLYRECQSHTSTMHEQVHSVCTGTQFSGKRLTFLAFSFVRISLFRGYCSTCSSGIPHARGDLAS